MAELERISAELVEVHKVLAAVKDELAQARADRHSMMDILRTMAERAAITPEQTMTPQALSQAVDGFIKGVAPLLLHQQQADGVKRYDMKTEIDKDVQAALERKRTRKLQQADMKTEIDKDVQAALERKISRKLQAVVKRH